jgi:hypothetical protein
MTQIEVVVNPELEGKRRALVLTEDRVGHYPNSGTSSCAAFLWIPQVCRDLATCGPLLE